jgi:hypothetical protein
MLDSCQCSYVDASLLSRSIVGRWAKTAVIASVLQIAINQEGAILRKDVSASRWLRMILTIVVRT